MDSDYYKYTWNITNRWSKIIISETSGNLVRTDKFLNNNFLIIQNSGMNNDNSLPGEVSMGEASTNLISFFTLRSKFVK